MRLYLHLFRWAPVKSLSKMAFLGRHIARPLAKTQNIGGLARWYGTTRHRRVCTSPVTKYLWLFGSGLAIISLAKWKSLASSVHAMNVRNIKDVGDKAIKLTAREKRFIKFASVEFDGQLYMTPQDFLDSVVEQEPRPRLKRRLLSVTDVEQIKTQTPSLSNGSSHLFRKLRDRGIVSYTEYLFLLSILTKPKSGFLIAFNMFDTDGNKRVDKNEFLVIRSLLGGSLRERDLDEATKEALLRLVSTSEQAEFLLANDNAREKQKMLTNEAADGSKSAKKKKSFMEKIFTGAWSEKHYTKETVDDDGNNNTVQGGDHLAKSKGKELGVIIEEESTTGLQRKHKISTTLQIHLFGQDGKKDLQYEGFHNFMTNLQTEVLDLEFHEFSKGNPQITKVDFAKILLRYTYLNTDEYDMYLDRLLDRIKDDPGISFVEFRDFCQFLNNLDDFSIAMRIYTLADQSISKDEFSRAVKICTGYSLSDHLINIVFAIFDEDGDGLLSHKEFIAIMKDRIHRGFKSAPKTEGWKAFKSCVISEMNSLKL